MKKINFVLVISGVFLSLSPLAVRAQINPKVDFISDYRLYKVNKTAPEKMTRGVAPYIADGHKPNISSSEAVSCTSEYCEFKFGIFVLRDYVFSDEVTIPVVVSIINGDKKYVQTFKVTFAKNEQEARLVFNGRLFSGGENDIKIVANQQNVRNEYDTTNNGFGVTLTLVKDRK